MPDTPLPANLVHSMPSGGLFEEAKRRLDAARIPYATNGADHLGIKLADAERAKLALGDLSKVVNQWTFPVAEP